MIGFFDDKFHLSSNIKLSLFVIIILLFIFFNNIFQIQNIKFSFLLESIDISYISLIFTILAFLLFINAFNMFDGINLQSGFYSIFIFSIFLHKGIFIESSFFLIISLLFFLFLNFKNKCFLGNNGTLFISFVISYFFIKASVLYNSFFADEIFLIMMIPGIDLLRLAIFRIWSRKHPFNPDRNHIHHILVNNLGFLKATIILNFLTIVPYIITVLFGYIAYITIFILLLYFLLIFKYSFIKKY
jgi:UDP-GlcNAc:undecaprenyl-phosphate GlcNAc-1-phosphate transferase